jgi:hypothetical protein
MMSVVLDSIRKTSEATDQTSLLAISRFFGIAPTGEVMQRLTGKGSSVLERVKNGGNLGSVDDRSHLEVLAAFVRELQSYLAHAMGPSSPDSLGMERWLAGGEVEVGSQTYRPIEALSDRVLAVGALSTLRATLD